MCETVPPRLLVAVFDETHFTKFATWYVTGHYYVDIHPPLAKLVFAWVLQARGFIGAEEEHVVWWYVRCRLAQFVVQLRGWYPSTVWYFAQ